MDDKTRLLRLLSRQRNENAAGAQAHRRRRWPVWAQIVATAVMAAGAMWFTFTYGDLSAQAELSQSRAEPTTAKPEPRAASLIASGHIVARRKAAIATYVTGKVIDVSAEEGMAVREGQVLARLDSELAEKDLALAKSRAEAAEAASAAIAAELREAEHCHNRTKALSERNFSSAADLTKAEARTAVLRAQLRQSEAQLATAKLDIQRAEAFLDKHQIRATFPGVVAECSAQPGELISTIAGGGAIRTEICTIVDMNSIEIAADVTETGIGRVKPGTRVDAVLDAYPDWTIPGSVIAIAPSANREKGTVKVRIGLKKKDPRILPDMAVKVAFKDDAVGRTGFDVKSYEVSVGPVSP